MKKITIEDLEGRFRSLEKIVFDHIGTPEKPARYEYTEEYLVRATNGRLQPLLSA